jgi:hypothetical protein
MNRPASVNSEQDDHSPFRFAKTSTLNSSRRIPVVRKAKVARKHGGGDREMADIKGLHGF